MKHFLGIDLCDTKISLTIYDVTIQQGQFDRR